MDPVMATDNVLGFRQDMPPPPSTVHPLCQAATVNSDFRDGPMPVTNRHNLTLVPHLLLISFTLSFHPKIYTQKEPPNQTRLQHVSVVTRICRPQQSIVGAFATFSITISHDALS
jgi:hypothetical protein